MTISFKWDTGGMTFNPAMVIENMPISNYRKFIKLFGVYGDPRDHQAFLTELVDTISVAEHNIQAGKELSHSRGLLRRCKTMCELLLKYMQG